MHRGYIKLWRKIRDSAVFTSTTPDLLKVWIWCLTKASRTHRWVSWPTGRGSTEVELQPGQFIFGRHSAARELRGLSARQVQSRMEKLAKLGNLVLKTGTHFSVVSLCHWETYQADGQATVQATVQPTVTQRAGNGHPTVTNKKEKNVEKGESEKNKSGKAAVFVPPTVEEARAYCEERHNGIDPERFIDYYAARGWKYKTGQPMKDWRAAVRTWEKNKRGQDASKTDRADGRHRSGDVRPSRSIQV